MRVTFAPAARLDLLEIADFIARDSVDTALRVLSEIEAAARRLAENPEIGQKRPDLAPSGSDLRFWPIYSYLIVYRHEPETLEVARVVSGYRDVPSVLE